MFGLQVATQFNPIGYPAQIFFNQFFFSIPIFFAKKKKLLVPEHEFRIVFN